jgi:hypothetical protein
MSVRTACLSVGIVLMLTGNALSSESSRLDIRFDDAEAERALEIVELRARSGQIGEEAWSALLATDGYQRLKIREAAMQRPFTDDEFREFLLEPGMTERAPGLREILDRWREADLSAAAARALEYLPATATIRATIYPMVKPKTNSFVFDLASDPAIFLYLNPEVTDAKFANTVAHELHHIGFGTACPPPEIAAEIEGADGNLGRVIRWQGAFGEGLAMLAAAGGPDVHPHADSAVEDRERWDRDVARYEEDVATLDAYFLDLLDGRLSEEEEIARARSFYGEQGAWYTVGWRIGETIERELGREELIRAACDPRMLLPTHRRALERRGRSAWSDRLLAALAGG